MAADGEKTTTGHGTTTAVERVAHVDRQAEAKARAKRHDELADLLSAGQLVLWPEAERGIPNELVRCALFSAKNRKESREVYRANMPLKVPVIGGGEIKFIGEELRQDDETVWMQLVHLSKEARSEWVSFTPHSFIQAIRWPVSGASYARLLTSIRRLASCSIDVYSPRLGKGVGTRLIAKYEYSGHQGDPWRVQVFEKSSDELLFLFDKLYSRLDWETRLALPEGVATWLHGFFSSHREPFGHRVETLAIGAGLTLEKAEDAELTEGARASKRKERLREAKKTIKQALQALKDMNFLADFEVTRAGIVNVQRVPRLSKTLDS